MHLPPTLKIKCVKPRELATWAGPKFSMSPPPSQRKMKAMRPPIPRSLLCMEDVVLFNSHSEDHSSMKERASESRNVAPSTEDAEFRVVCHDRVLQTWHIGPLRACCA